MRMHYRIIGLMATATAVGTLSCSPPADRGSDLDDRDTAEEVASETAGDAGRAAATAEDITEALPEGFEAVESSLVKGVKYDAASRTLDIILVGGTTYPYAGVPQDLYHEFMSAESKGSFYTTNIKGKFGGAE